MEHRDLFDHAQLIANVVTSLGLISGILIFLREINRQRREREIGTYDSLDEKYIEYLRIFIDHPEIKLSNTDSGMKSMKRSISKDEYARFVTSMEILVCLLERAYLLYYAGVRKRAERSIIGKWFASLLHLDENVSLKESQWQGWRKYLEDWCDEEEFLTIWQAIGSQYDSGFAEYVDDIIAKQKRRRPAKAS